jgi:hypothetical protein
MDMHLMDMHLMAMHQWQLLHRLNLRLLQSKQTLLSKRPTGGGSASHPFFICCCITANNGFFASRYSAVSFCFVFFLYSPGSALSDFHWKAGSLPFRIAILQATRL